MNSLVIGIDISKQKFDASFSLHAKAWHHQVFDNATKGFENFLKWLNPYSFSSIHIVFGVLKKQQYFHG